MVARDTTVELVVRKEADELSKYGSSLVQVSSPSSLISKDYGTELEDRNSNRLSLSSRLSYWITCTYSVLRNHEPDSSDLKSKI